MSSNVYDPKALGLEIAGKSGEELVVNCPYHSDAHPSAEYNVFKGLFFCFGCHTAKTAKQLAKDLGGYLTKVPVQSISGFVDLDLEDEEKEWMRLLMNPLAIGNEYLESRKVAEWQVERHSIRASKNAIFFPMADDMGELKGFQARQINKKPKYLFHGERVPLWPMDTLIKGVSRFAMRRVLVVEGVFGALRAELAGVPAVATMGASSIAGTISFLKQSGMMRTTEFIFWMDADPAGFLAAGKYCLHGFSVIIPEEVPPDEQTTGGIIRKYARAHEFSTDDVNDVIGASPDPFGLQRKLEKYWEKM